MIENIGTSTAISLSTPRSVLDITAPPYGATRDSWTHTNSVSDISSTAMVIAHGFQPSVTLVKEHNKGYVVRSQVTQAWPSDVTASYGWFAPEDTSTVENAYALFCKTTTNRHWSVFRNTRIRLRSLEELNDRPNASASATDFQISSVSSTAPEMRSEPPVVARVQRAMRSAQNEWFESGMESGLSREITQILMTHSSACITALTPYILEGYPTEDVVAEAILTLGRIHHQSTRSERLTLLLKLVSSPSYLLRDAAITGLSYANDTSVIPTLEAIAERSDDEQLRLDIAALVKELKN